MIDTQILNRLLRGIEAFKGENCKRTVIGHFYQNDNKYGIRLQKTNFNPEHGNILYSVLMSIEIPTCSGLVYVAIGEFNAYHKEACKDIIPKIRLDKHWLSWESVYLQNREKCSVTVYPDMSSAKKHIYEISGNNKNEKLSDIESQIFQHNLICDNDMFIDSEHTKTYIGLALDEFDYMYNNDCDCISIDLKISDMKIAEQNIVFPIQYDKIAEVIENYVQVQGK